MEWIILLLPVIIDLIQECREKQKRNYVFTFFTRRQRVGKFLLRLKLRSLDWEPEDIKIALESLEAYVAENPPTDEYLNELLDMAESQAREAGVILA